MKESIISVLLLAFLGLSCTAQPGRTAAQVAPLVKATADQEFSFQGTVEDIVPVSDYPGRAFPATAASGSFVVVIGDVKAIKGEPPLTDGQINFLVQSPTKLLGQICSAAEAVGRRFAFAAAISKGGDTWRLTAEKAN